MMKMFLLSIIVLTASAQEKGAEWTGHLADAMCASTWKGEAGAYQAKRHTRECAFHKKCQASGFGVFRKGKFYPFDSASNAKAIAFLKGTRLQDDILVVVRGTMRNDVLAIDSISLARVSPKPL